MAASFQGFRSLVENSPERLEAQQLTEELASSNLRLEEFAHHVAHDLREPLLTGSLYAQLLLRKVELEPNAKTC